MSDDKKTTKAKPKAEAKEPTVFLVYRGEISEVSLFSGANDAMDAITKDRDLKVERVLMKRGKRRAKA
jgi:hypothetical protein